MREAFPELFSPRARSLSFALQDGGWRILGLDSLFPYREHPNPEKTFILTGIDPYA